MTMQNSTVMLLLNAPLLPRQCITGFCFHASQICIYDMKVLFLNIISADSEVQSIRHEKQQPERYMQAGKNTNGIT